MFLIVLVAIFTAVIFFIGKFLLQNIKNQRQKTFLIGVFTFIGFALSAYFIFYIFLFKSDNDAKHADEVKNCIGYEGKISLGDVIGKWQLQNGFISINEKSEVVSKGFDNKIVNTGRVSFESNIMTITSYNLELKDTIVDIYKICDISKNYIEGRVISTEFGVNKKTMNENWKRVE